LTFKNKVRKILILREEEFDAVQKKINQNSDALCLIKDEPGRWSSTYKKLERIKKLEEATISYQNEISHIFFAKEDYIKIGKYLDLLEDFKDVTLDASKSDLTSSIIIPLSYYLLSSIKNEEEADINFIEIRQNLYDDMIIRFAPYFRNIYLIASTILDPKYRLLGVREACTQEDIDISIDLIKAEYDKEDQNSFQDKHVIPN